MYIPSPGTKGIIPGITNNIAGYFNFLARISLIKATKAAAKKVEVTVEFAGKAYSTEQLAKIAKDVWVYDLGRKATEFKTVEIYVKPEESRAYFVVNGDVTGSFAL